MTWIKEQLEEVRRLPSCAESRGSMLSALVCSHWCDTCAAMILDWAVRHDVDGLERFDHLANTCETQANEIADLKARIAAIEAERNDRVA